MGNPDFEWRFGCLPQKYPIEFAGGAILPLENVDDVNTYMQRLVARDNYIYPPIDKEHASGPRKLTPTHMVVFPGRQWSQELETEDVFLMHLAGFLFERQVQFGHWWVYDRIRWVRSRLGDFDKGRASEFISTAYETWKGWAEKARTIMTNVLFLHPAHWKHRFTYEKFSHSYMLLDACWRVVEMQGLIRTRKTPPHPQRLALMIERFGLWDDAEKRQMIVKRRRELVHEAVWQVDEIEQEKLPGHGDDEDSFYCAFGVHLIVARLIPAILGFEARDKGDRWWGGQHGNLF